MRVFEPEYNELKCLKIMIGSSSIRNYMLERNDYSFIGKAYSIAILGVSITLPGALVLF